ncbi:hypothetical protein QLX08_007654 [Tetragonisca angustula]|uniref:Uncharacterized protein n=1 Tax=Tetragonisca angustula TaxID=166442 RepID=A0AAW0ZND3_9HYME
MFRCVEHRGWQATLSVTCRAIGGYRFYRFFIDSPPRPGRKSRWLRIFALALSPPPFGRRLARVETVRPRVQMHPDGGGRKEAQPEWLSSGTRAVTPRAGAHTSPLNVSALRVMPLADFPCTHDTYTPVYKSLGTLIVQGVPRLAVILPTERREDVSGRKSKISSLQPSFPRRSSFENFDNCTGLLRS